MAGIARHLFHYPSAIDGVQQPYLVCGPELPQENPLPVVVVLHDTLPMPTPPEFIEEAFTEAARWLGPLEAVEPMLLVLPFGHGNAGWLGFGGRDLFDVMDRLSYQYSIDYRRVSLFGIGAGGTGALQLACWFPDRISAVAAVGAWSDPALDLAPGQEDWPPWEKAQRLAVSPLALIKNLQHKPVHLEHPWWLLGFSGSVSTRHFHALKQELSRSKLARFVDDVSMNLMRETPANRTALLQWLVEQSLAPGTAHLTTYSLRSDSCGPVQIERIARKGSPASCDVTGNNGTLRVKTRNVDTLLVRNECLAPNVALLHVDKQEVEIAAGKASSILLERHAGKWQPLKPASDAEAESATTKHWTDALLCDRLSGPMMDLRWDSVLFVAGTLGAEDDNERMSQFLDDLRRRWKNGEDSLQMHPGDATAAIEFPSAVDVEVTDEMLASHHLILVGNPWNNLLLARFAGGLPCQWERSETAASMTFAGKRYADPADVLFLLARNPEVANRYVLVIGVNETSALVDASKIRTAFLPDYLVHRGTKVLTWGYADWSSDAPG